MMGDFAVVIFGLLMTVSALLNINEGLRAIRNRLVVPQLKSIKSRGQLRGRVAFIYGTLVLIWGLLTSMTSISGIVVLFFDKLIALNLLYLALFFLAVTFLIEASAFLYTSIGRTDSIQ
ncbi:MAG: hypothetical protein KF726_04955 [Anaerolineae bacterium]|nr:hypothetical protein [Anaerolineae bacterium]